jgi:hypothetical protein
MVYRSVLTQSKQVYVFYDVPTFYQDVAEYARKG